MPTLRTHIGPHRLCAMLGRGGDAEVWAAEEALTRTPVAIKCTRRDKPSSGTLGLRGRIIREYQYLRQLALPFVPRARGLIHDDGRLCLVMDLIDGTPVGTWADTLLEDAPNLPRVLEVLGQCARRLLDLHAEGLLHGDLKPSCFMVGPDDRVHLLDLGGARPLDGTLLTQPIAEHFGTPTFAAPELLALGPPTLETEAFGFAATVFRVLTGDVPAGRARRAELLARWTSDPPSDLLSRLRTACPDLPLSIAEPLVSALSPDPRLRPSLTTLAALFPTPTLRVLDGPPEPPLPPSDTALSIALGIASTPLPPRTLAATLGLTPGAVSNQLARHPRAERLDPAWRLCTPAPPPIDPTHAALATSLSLSLAELPVSLAHIRALAHRGDAESTLAALERWVTALGHRGRLAEAINALHLVPLEPSLEARRTLLEARLSLARPSLEPGLDHRLAMGLRDPLYGKAHLRARWDLARHFGTFHAESSPIALGVGWRALLVGDLDAALTSAMSALDEARWLRQSEAEADALVLLARVHGTRGATSVARAFAAEAIDRWPARAPGLGEAVATLARLELAIGALSEARAHLIAYADEMPTPIDTAHLELALAELEALMGHRAVAFDLLKRLDHPGLSPALAPRVLALRLEVSEVDLDDAHDQCSALMRQGCLSDLAILGPALIAALREADRHDDPLARATFTAIERTSDLHAELRWHAAIGLESASNDALVDLVRRASEAELWPALMQLGRARGDELLAWRALKRILPHLSRGDQSALALEPWAVAASRLEGPE